MACSCCRPCSRFSPGRSRTSRPWSQLSFLSSLLRQRNRFPDINSRGESNQRMKQCSRRHQQRGRSNSYHDMALPVHIDPSADQAGSAPYRLRHNASLITTTLSFPGCSSSAENPRPRSIGTPRKEKKLAETRAPPRRSGSPSPVRLHSHRLRALIAAKAVSALRHSR